MTVELEDGDSARLNWTANTEADLAGHHVFRDGDRITTELLPDTTYLDPDLLEGTYVYTVLAVDLAGNQSEPSNPAELVVDVTPPTVRIQRPGTGDTVSGLVDVKGTAFSQDDFKEYRLFVGAGETPTTLELLRRSPVPIQSDLLAQWSTLGLTEGAPFTLRLEGEDLTGNVGVDTAVVIIDNLPPAAPTGLTATELASDPDGVINDVQLDWAPNTEDDLLGYLLFRDDRLANADGLVIGDLRNFVITPDEFLDLNLPDGRFTYEVFAMDEAGNISDPSLPADAEIDTRPPAAIIVSPLDGTQFDTTLHVLATTEDRDVANVQFQFKAAAELVWTDLGALDTAEPWETRLDPNGLSLSFGDYDLRAVATDQGGLFDLTPASIRVTFTDLTRPERVLDLVARVDGGDVELTWTANTDADLAGYHVDRTLDGGTTIRLTTTPITETRLVDMDLPDGLYTYTVTAVDTSGNEADPSAPADALVYTPELRQPFTPIRERVTALQGSGVAEAEVQADVTNASGATSLPAVQTDTDGNFVLVDIPLELGDNTIAVVIEDAEGNRSKSASVRVLSGDPPSPPTGLAAVDLGGFEVEVTWNANPEPNVIGYRLFRDDEPLSEPVQMLDLFAPQASSAGSPTFRAVDNNPVTYWAPNVFSGQPVAGQWIVVAFPEERWITDVEILWWSVAFEPPWVYGASDYDLEAWDGNVWVPLASVRDNTEARQALSLDTPYFTSRIRVFLRASIQPETLFWPIRLAEVDVVHIPLLETRIFNETLPDGEFTYTATAVNDLGFESGPSDLATVVLGDAIVLTATVTGSDVDLVWTPASSPEIVRYDVFRDGTKIGEVTNLADLHLLDSGRPNGTYRYFVRPVDGDEVAGDPSNEEEVTVDVPVPAPPMLISVDNVLGGQALDLLWEPGAGSTPVGYDVLRSTVSGGPYESVGMSTETSFRDESVTAGITYYYVIVALDIVGNPSLPSNELSGTPEDNVPPKIPVLHAPGFPAIPLVTRREVVDVIGTTEAGATVTLFRAGQALAEVQARAELETNAAAVFGFDVVMSPNGRYLWLSEFPDRLFDFETASDEVTAVRSNAVVWSPDSESLLYIDDFGRKVRRYRISDGNDSEVFEIDFVLAVQPSPLDDRLAVLGRRGDMGLWLYDPASDDFRLLVEDASFQIFRAIYWSPDATRILFGTDFDTLEVVEVTTGEVTILDDRGGILPLGWSPDGKVALFSTSSEVWAYDFELGAAAPITSDSREHFNATYSPDGRSIGIAFEGTGVFALDVATGELEPLLETSKDLDVLQWVKSGDLLIVLDGDPFRLRPPGVFTLPAVNLLKGDNTFTALAEDGSGNQSELSEEMLVTLRFDNRPDLAIAFEDLRAVPAAARLGDLVRVSATVRNLGPVASAVSDISLSLFGPADLVETLAERENVPPLAPGAAFTLTRDVSETSVVGTFRLVATADPFDEIPEVSEINNQAERTFEIVDGSGPLVTATTDRPSYSIPILLRSRIPRAHPYWFSGTSPMRPKPRGSERRDGKTEALLGAISISTADSIS